MASAWSWYILPTSFLSFHSLPIFLPIVFSPSPPSCDVQVTQLLSSPRPPSCLIATYRSPASATALLALAQATPTLHALLLDVADVPSHAAFVAQVTDLVGDTGLNLLINNAGMNPKKDLDSVTPEDMVAAFSTNCVAPLFLARALLPLIQRAADRQPAEGLSTFRAAIVQVTMTIGLGHEDSLRIRIMVKHVPFLARYRPSWPVSGRWGPPRPPGPPGGQPTDAQR